MDCKHEFIGNAEGVKCPLCGVKLTQQEYREYLKGNKAQKGDFSTSVAVEEPKPEPKKTTKKTASTKKK